MLKERILSKLKGVATTLPGCYIAGGAVRSVICGEEVNDYDVFPKTLRDALNTIRSWEEDDGGVFIHVSDRAVTCLIDGTRYQMCLTGVHDTSEKVWKTFDYTSCMAALDCDTMELHHDPRFIRDCLSRTLVYNPSTLYPYCSLRRMHKFRKRGWNITNAEQFKIAHSCPKIASWDELKTQLGGFYGTVIDIPDAPFTEEVMYEALTSLRDVEGSEACEPVPVEDAYFAVLRMVNFEGCTYDVDNETLHVGDFMAIEVRHKDSVPSHVQRKETIVPEGCYFKAVKSTEDPKVFRSWHNSSFKYELGKAATTTNPKGLFVCRTFKDAVVKAKHYGMDTIIACVGHDLISESPEIRFRTLHLTDFVYKVAQPRDGRWSVF